MEKEIREMMKAVDCESSCVWMKEGDVMFPYIFLGPASRKMEGMELPSNQGLCGYCITHDKEIISNDLEHDVRWNTLIDDQTGYHTHNIICLPLTLYDEVYGCIELINKKDGFCSKDVCACRGIADYILKSL